MSQIRAAAGRVELTPPVGARLTGFATRLEPAAESHDPLTARALLLDDGDTRVAWIACDLIGFSVEDDASLRERIATRLKVSPSHVLVSCTHTHSGPPSMPFRGPLGQIDPGWLNRMFEAIAGCAASLAHQLKRATLSHATTTVTGLGYNRQDGVSAIDERLLVAQFRDETGRAIATILNYATHPVVLGERNMLFSADYPGYAARSVEESAGGLAMFILGAAGDVDPTVYRDRGRQAGTFEVAEAMGRTLADAAIRALEAAATIDQFRLAVAESHVEVPLDPPPAIEEVIALKSQLQRRLDADAVAMASNEAKWAMFELPWATELERAIRDGRVPRMLRVRLTGLRVGNLRVVAFPLELYSQIGLDLRGALSPHPVIIAGYTNGLLGYAPTDLAKQQGGYGPSLSHRFFPDLLTPLGDGSGTTLTMAAVEIVRRLTPAP